jgi:hypothetical protein
MSAILKSPKKKPGRPKSGITRITPSLSLTVDAVKLAKRAAARNGMSLSGFVEQAIRKQLTGTEA